MRQEKHTAQIKVNQELSANGRSSGINPKKNVKCRQEFVGDDIAFCHWEADNKQVILDWLDELGVNEYISTELHEQWRFTSFYNQSDEMRDYKEY